MMAKISIINTLKEKQQKGAQHFSVDYCPDINNTDLRSQTRLEVGLWSEEKYDLIKVYTPNFKPTFPKKNSMRYANGENISKESYKMCFRTL